MTTATSLPPKDSVAEKLALAHYQIEPGISRIVRLLSPSESDPNEPIKLLEVNANTVALGIQPVGFGPHSASGIHYGSIIVEITPDEYDQFVQGRLSLPDGWTLGQEYAKPT